MNVLNLVTNPESRFFAKQVAVLESRDCVCTTVGVPGHRDHTHVETSGRSLVDYIRFYPRVLSALDGHDVVHANYGLTAPAALAQPTRPVVISLWGSDLMGRFGPLSQWCARYADAVIVMTEEMAAMLDADCHVIPHGVDLDQFQPIPRDVAREQVGWSQEDVHVLFPYPESRTVKDYPRAEQVVDVAAEAIDEDVQLQTLHGVAHERMPAYVNAADVLLLTSKREGSPNSVKEALACNVPVVSTDVGDVSERLEGVDHSYVCRTDEELIDGLTRVFRDRSRSNGREAAKRISLERMGDRLVAIYESVLIEEPKEEMTVPSLR